MKIKTLSLFGLLLTCLAINGLAQSEKWHHYNYASSGQCAISSYVDMVFDNSGNTYAVGIVLVNPTVSSFCFKQANIIVDKFDNLGNVTATYQYDYNGLEEDDTPVSIKWQSSTNKIFVLGKSHGFNILLKLSGNLLYQGEKRYYDIVPVGFEVGFNSIYVAANSGDGAVTLRYKTASFALIGYNLYEGATVNDCELSSDGLLITGSAPTSSNGTAFFLEKFDSLINPVWTKTYNRFTGAYNDQGNIIRVVNSNIYVGGSCQNSVVSNIGVIYKYNNQGTQAWNRLLKNSIATNDYSPLYDLSPDIYNQDIYILGASTLPRVFKYNSSGTEFWHADIPVIAGTNYSGFGSILNNGSGSVPASTVFLTGYNSYPGTGGFANWERGLTYWITSSSGAFVYSDYEEAGGGFDPSFFYGSGKINNKVSPFLYVAVGNGRTEAGNPQASGTNGFIDCYNISGPLPRKANDPDNAAFKVYPNPVKDEITISSSVPCETIEISDINGKLLQSEKATGLQTIIKAENLSPGMYFIRVKNNEGEYTQKFFKTQY